MHTERKASKDWKPGDIVWEEYYLDSCLAFVPVDKTQALRYCGRVVRVVDYIDQFCVVDVTVI